MANSLHLSREVKVWVKFGASYWNVPILDGLSFSQSTNTAEVSVKEMGASDNTSRRGRLMFNDSLSPAEWSFSTYMRPFVREISGPADEHHAVEEVLWAMLVGADTADYSAGTDKFDEATSINNTATQATMKFGKSNALTFPDAGLPSAGCFSATSVNADHALQRRKWHLCAAVRHDPPSTSRAVIHYSRLYFIYQKMLPLVCVIKRFPGHIMMILKP